MKNKNVRSLFLLGFLGLPRIEGMFWGTSLSYFWTVYSMVMKHGTNIDTQKRSKMMKKKEFRNGWHVFADVIRNLESTSIFAKLPIISQRNLKRVAKKMFIILFRFSEYPFSYNSTKVLIKRQKFNVKIPTRSRVI